MPKITSGVSKITLEGNFSSTSKGCVNDVPCKNTFTLNASYIPPFKVVHVYFNGHCGGFWGAKVTDSRNVSVYTGGGGVTCFDGATCGAVGKPPVTITYEPAVKCSDDSCRVDCIGQPDGFCCIDHSFTNSCLAILNQ